MALEDPPEVVMKPGILTIAIGLLCPLAASADPTTQTYRLTLGKCAQLLTELGTLDGTNIGVATDAPNKRSAQYAIGTDVRRVIAVDRAALKAVVEPAQKASMDTLRSLSNGSGRLDPGSKTQRVFVSEMSKLAAEQVDVALTSIAYKDIDERVPAELVYDLAPIVVGAP
jgi:hypothetical protein